MYSSRLIKVLKTFTEREIKELNSFLEASIISKRIGKTKCFALFKLISKYHPNFDHANLNKEKIFRKLYKSSYESGKLEKLMSDLVTLIQEFILYQHADIKKELPPLRILYDFYSRRNLNGLASLTLKKHLKAIKLKKDIDSTVLYEQFLFEKTIFQNQILFSNTKNKQDFSTVHSSLDHYYIFEKLELACQLLATNRFLYPVEVDENLKVIEHLKPLLEQDFFDKPLIKLFYKAYCFLNSNEKDIEINFSIFEQSLKKYAQDIPDAQHVMVNTIVRNYCVWQFHKGTEGYIEKTFETYKDHLERGFLYVEDNIFASTMMNIVIFGLKLKRYDWVYDFLTSHKDRIVGVLIPEEAYKLNLANYYFHIAAFEKALDLISYNFKDIFYKLRAKRMEIKIYFEIKHVLLIPKIDAFKIFIYRLPSQKISKKHKGGNREFIDTLKQIVSHKTYKNNIRIEKLKSKIHSSSFVNEKTWLLEKLSALS